MAVFYVEDCGESNAFSECGQGNVGFVVCIVGKMAQDVGMVETIVVSFPSSLVGFSRVPCACFHLENFSVTCSCWFFICFF